MFRKVADIFNLKSETRARIGSDHDSDVHEQKYSAAGKRILQLAKQYKKHTDWSCFKPGDPKCAMKHIYNVDESTWTIEDVLVEIDASPFGRGALRECFRMKEVAMKEGSFQRQVSEDDGSLDDLSNRNTTDSAELLAAVVEIQRSRRRRCWVAKRSMNSHADKEQHKKDCLADAALQQVAKHYGELFGDAVRERKQATDSKTHPRVQQVDFLMSHVIELVSDGSTYGVEAFVFGEYEKYNNNSGGVTRPLDWVTPQAFSYFSFIHSGFRLMVVDIQGVDDLYTDPAMHYLREHNPDLLALGDQSVNLGVRGMALFLWSHRRNPVDRFLELPNFLHALSEQRAVGGIAGLTVAQLASVQTKKRGSDGEQKKPAMDAQERPKNDETVLLEDVPGIDLRLQAWKDVCVCPELSKADAPALPLSLVVAACHMEIAFMYHEGRIGEHTYLTKAEAEAAVFHLVLAAQAGLPEALLGLARLCSNNSHDDFLSSVQGDAEYGNLCLLLLGHVSKASGPSAVTAHGALATILSSGALGEADAARAAFQYEAFADAVVAGNDSGMASAQKGLDVTSCYGYLFEWDNHGLEAHSAYAAAAEIHQEAASQDSLANSKRLWEAAYECALENPCLAKKAMRYMEKAESIEDPPEEEDVSKNSPEEKVFSKNPPEQEDYSKNPPEEEDVSKSKCESDSIVEVACAQFIVDKVKPDVVAKFEAYAKGFKTKADALAALLALATGNTEASDSKPKDDDVPVKRIEVAYDEDVWAMLGPA